MRLIRALFFTSLLSLTVSRANAKFTLAFLSDDTNENWNAKKAFDHVIREVNFTIKHLNFDQFELTVDNVCQHLQAESKLHPINGLITSGSHTFRSIMNQQASRFDWPIWTLADTHSSDSDANLNSRVFSVRHPYAQLARLIREIVPNPLQQSIALYAPRSITSRFQTELDAYNISYYEIHSFSNQTHAVTLPKNEKLIFLLADTGTLNFYLDTLNINDKLNSWRAYYVFNTNMENVNCSTCRYASFTVLKPKWNSLHYPPNSTDLHHQLPTFLSTFYYDLAKLINRLIEPTLKSTAKQSNIIENVCSLSLSTQNSSNSTSTIANDNQLQSVSTANVFGRLGDWKTYYVHRKASSYKWYLQFAVQIVRVRYLNRTATRRRVQEWNDGATLGKLYQTSHLQDDDEDERAVQDDDSSGSQKLTMFVVVHPPFLMRRVKPQEAKNTTETKKGKGRKDKSQGKAEDKDDDSDEEEKKEKKDGQSEGEDEEDEEDEEDDDDDDDDTKTVEFEYYGFLIDLFDEIKQEIEKNGEKFPDYEFKEVEPGPSAVGMFYGGDRLDKGKAEFTGILKEMADSKSDSMALAAMSVTASRKLVMDFSEPLFRSVGITILMKKPRRKPHFFKFVTVLESKVWACIAGAYFFTSLLLAIFEQFSPNKSRHRAAKLNAPLSITGVASTVAARNGNTDSQLEADPNEEDDAEPIREFTFKESLWFCITSLTPQGGGEAPRSLYGRLVAATWWLFGFIVIASYTANLAAFLTVSRLETKIDDLKKLSKQYKVRYAPVEDTSTDFYFLQMAEIEEKFYEIWKDMSLNDTLSEDERANLAVWDYPVSDRYTKIAAQMGEADKPKTIEAAVTKVRESKDDNDGFAILAESLTVDYFSMQFCDLYKVGEEFAPRPLAFAVSKKNRQDLLAMLDPAIRRLEIRGRIEELQVNYWKASDGGDLLHCEEFRKLNNGISLLNAGGVFLVIGCGLILTLCILTLENMILLHLKIARARKAHFPPSPSLPESTLRKCLMAPWRTLWLLFTGSRK